MRPLPTITDPTYQAKSPNAFERILLKYIKDERDVPFAYLCLKIMLTVIPLAIAVALDFSWLLLPAIALAIRPNAMMVIAGRLGLGMTEQQLCRRHKQLPS